MLTYLAVITIFPAAMILVGIWDLLTMTIPNKLSLGMTAAFFVLAPFAGLGWQDILWHVVAGGAMLAIGFALFVKGWIGGGDAKFFAATVLWLGLEPLFSYTAYAAIFGGVLTLALLLFSNVPFPKMLESQKWLKRLHDLKHGIPYGVALGTAGLVIFPQTAWMMNLAG